MKSVKKKNARQRHKKDIREKTQKTKSKMANLTISILTLNMKV